MTNARIRARNFFIGIYLPSKIFPPKAREETLKGRLSLYQPFTWIAIKFRNVFHFVIIWRQKRSGFHYFVKAGPLLLLTSQTPRCAGLIQHESGGRPAPLSYYPPASRKAVHFSVQLFFAISTAVSNAISPSGDRRTVFAFGLPKAPAARA
ncbi:hypothetical protein [Dysosmobacter sp. Sow4_B12]|uniref:hypothetical protein n=1 Tax=Dysosmobacter sp. Sow4_B12 TaxID=3438777 RepID=UPI003F931380